MAQYQVKYKCGCKENKELRGKVEERRKKIKWYETIECFTCKSKKYNNKYNLVGSPKQIIWAEEIINQNLKKYKKFRARCMQCEKWIKDEFLPKINNKEISIKKYSELEKWQRSKYNENYDLKDTLENIDLDLYKNAGWIIDNRGDGGICNTDYIFRDIKNAINNWVKV